MSLLQACEGDLRAICAEVKRRAPAVKNATERALQLLHTIESAVEPHAANATEYELRLSRALRGSTDVLLLPLQIASGSKSTKAAALVVGCLQRLIAHNALSRRAVPDVLKLFAFRLTSADQAVQIRVLQSIVTLVTGVNLHGETLARALVACFSLYAMRNNSVHSSAASTARQLVIMLFDRAAAELSDGDELVVSSSDSEGSSASSKENESSNVSESVSTDEKPFTQAPTTALAPSDLGPCASDAFLLLQDMCLLTAGDNPVWLPLSVLDTFDPEYGLELIESIVSIHHDMFINIRSFRSLAEDRLCPLLVQGLRVKPYFPLLVRLGRLVVAFVGKFENIMPQQCEVFLERLLRILDSSGLLWVKTVILEVFASFAQSEQLMLAFCVNYDTHNEGSQLFNHIVRSIGSFMQGTFEWESSAFVKTAHAAKIMDNLQAITAPTVERSYAVAVACDALSGVVQCLEQLAKKPKVKVAESSAENAKLSKKASRAAESSSAAESSINSRAVAIAMVDSVWPSIMGGLSLLLQKSSDEAVVQIVLKMYQSMIITSGNLGRSTPRDAFITSLSNFILAREQIAPTSATASTSAAGAVEDEEIDDSGNLVLTKKAVRATKTLLNIAHCTGDNLKSGWFIALETFEKLYLRLERYGQAPTEEGSAPLSELHIIKDAIDGVFRSSKFLDKEGLVDLLDSLNQLSFPARFDKTATKQPYSMFAITNMVTTTLNNLHRIDEIWDIVGKHLIFVMQHENAAIRRHGSNALTKIINAVFEVEDGETEGGNDANEEEESGSDGNGEIHTKATTARRMQEPILQALDTLSASPHYDVRENSLQCLYQVLHSSGQTFKQKAWMLLLDTLLRVAGGKGQLTVFGFKNTEYLCREFLAGSMLKSECVLRTIHVIGSYADQTTDMNISLTAIGLLWDVVDHIARAQKGSTKAADESLTKSWIAVFTQFKRLGGAERPDIRNGALMSLFKTVTTHGRIFQDEVWKAVMNEVLFPVVVQAKSLAAIAASTRIEREIGRDGKRTVKMLVHHSRDTEQKQWDETQMLCISGLSTTFKKFWTILRPLDDFASWWVRLLSMLEAFTASASLEVSSAAVRNLFEILLSRGSSSSAGEELEPGMWDNAWEVCCSVCIALTGGADGGGSAAPVDLLVVVAESLVTLFRDMQHNFTPAGRHKVYLMFRALVFFKGSAPNRLTPLQKTVLQLFRDPPKVTDGVFGQLIDNILSYIALVVNANVDFGSGGDSTNAEGSADGAEKSFAARATESEESATEYTLQIAFVPLAIECVSVLAHLFSAVSSEVRLIVFVDTVKVLGSAMLTKFELYESALWRSAVQALLSVVPLGLRAVDSASPPLEKVRKNVIWTEIIDTVQHFVFHDHLLKLTSEQLIEDETHDVSLLQMLAREVGRNNSTLDLVTERVVDLLVDGMICANRSTFSAGCGKSLFRLCAASAVVNGDCTATVASLTAAIVVERCGQILVGISRTTEDDPVPRELTPEESKMICMMLHHLGDVELPLKEGESSGGVRGTRSADAALRGPRRHLFALMPVLSGCIMCPNVKIRAEVSCLFKLIASELVLTKK